MNKNMKRILMASTLVGAFLLLLLAAGQDHLPRWIIWENAVLTPASAPYTAVLKHRHLEVTAADGGTLWVTPDSLKVQEALCSDIDNDGLEELILLCWKKGRYGTDRPFWVTQDETTWSQHIFLYEFSDGAIRPKWGSSYIGQEVSHMSVILRQDMRNHLLLAAPDRTVSSWLWDSWGFTRETTQVSFAVFGDNLIHEPLYRYGLNQGGDFDFLFDNFRDIIERSDVAIINQETPFVEDSALYGDYPRFGTPIEVGEAIANAGFDVVTCATNHALDRGAYGIRTTRDFFEAHGIACPGIQTGTEYEPYLLLTKNQIRFALLNYTCSTNEPIPDNNPRMVHLLNDEERVKKELAAARAAADIVLVFPHWGTENSTQIDAKQRRWTGLFLEAGVDVVVGTHPHVLQPCEVLTRGDGHEMLVYYSIGNYISAQPEKTSRKGGLACFTVSLTEDGYAVTDHALRPLVITAEQAGRYSVDFDGPSTPH